MSAKLQHLGPLEAQFSQQPKDSINVPQKKLKEGSVADKRGKEVHRAKAGQFGENTACHSSVLRLQD